MKDQCLEIVEIVMKNGNLIALAQHMIIQFSEVQVRPRIEIK